MSSSVFLSMIVQQLVVISVFSQEGVEPVLLLRHLDSSTLLSIMGHFFPGLSIPLTNT